MLRDHPKSVLVLEENPKIAQKLLEILSLEGFRVESAGEAQTALERAQELQPEFVLMEYLLPGAEDGALIEALQVQSPKSQILVMAASPSVRDRLMAKGLRVEGFLLKPFRRLALLEALKDLQGERLDPELSPVETEHDLRGFLSPMRPLNLLLLRLLREGATGILRLERDGICRHLYLLNGLPVSAESNLLDETLGRYLVQRKIINEEQYQAIERYRKAWDLRQGEALLALELLSQVQLYGLLRAQVRERALHCFAWEGARFSFRAEERFLDERPLFPLNPISLSIEALLRRDSSAQLEQLYHRHQKHKLSPGPLLEELSTYIDRLHSPGLLSALFRGGCSPAELLSCLGWSPSRVQGMVQALMELGLLQSFEPLEEEETLRELGACPAFLDPRMEPEPPAEDPQAAQVFKAYLRGRGDHYSALGLEPGADLRSLEAAWLTVNRSFHPDRLAKHPDAEVRERAKEVFLRASLAFKVLSKSASREAHLRELKLKSKVLPQIDAREEFARGQHLLQEKEHQGACQAFARACSAAPEQALYEMHLGWATFLAAEGTAAQRKGEAILLRALERAPGSAIGQSFLSRLYLSTKQEPLDKPSGGLGG